MTTDHLIYNWQRYLCPADQSYARTDDGYLIPPDTGLYRLSNTHLRTFDALTNAPCVIILGEPGIGKSTTLRETAAYLRQQLGPDDDVVEDSFTNFSTRSDLSELFNGAKFAAWQAGRGKLYLFLDSLDEAHERLDALLAGLIGNLRQQPLARLFLRIACRHTSWPSDKASHLGSLWKLQHLPLYKLTVLSQEDVRLAAQMHNIDPDRFLQEVRDSEVTPLAGIPITLNLLLEQRQATGSLPKTRAELYQQACTRICVEAWKPRRNRDDHRMTTASQRLLIAARLAALTFFAGRAVIDAGETIDPLDTNALPVRHLTGYGETLNGQTFDVDERTILETLNTGLLTAHPVDHYTWTHRTFQEYLAAYYLNHHALPIPQLTGLIAASGDFDSRFPPQLQDMLAWLASLRPDVKQLVLDRDPVILLDSDLTTLTEADREQLVAWLLSTVEQQQHFRSYKEYQRYQKLHYPKLADQLRSYLTDQHQSPETRRLAVDIAERCQVSHLQQTLVDLALDRNCPLLVRIDAADAIVRIGDNAAKAQLKPLLNNRQDGHFQQLKGAALRALWPDHLTARELFAAITPRGNNHALDNYYIFLVDKLAQHLTVNDLPEALAWVEQHTSIHEPDSEIQRLRDAILSRALANLAVPAVCNAAVTAILTKLEHHHNIFDARNLAYLQQTTDHITEPQRHILLKALLERCVEQGKDIRFVIWARPSLVTGADLSWLIHELYPNLSTRQQHALAVIIVHLWNPGDLGQTTLVYQATQQHTILAEYLTPDFQPIELASEQARHLMALHQQRRESQVPDEQLEQPTHIPLLESVLDKIEQGDAEQWWRLNLDLMVDPARGPYIDEHNTNIQSLPGWLRSDNQIRSRIIAAAKAYLMQGDPNTQEWFGKLDFRYRPAQAAYRALYLLHERDREFLLQLDPTIWAKWTPTLLSAHEWANPIDTEVDSALLALVVNKVPEEVSLYGVQILQLAPSRFELNQATARYAAIWQSQFTECLWAQLAGHPNDLDYARTLLPVLLEKDEDTARVYCKTLLVTRHAGNEHAQEAAVVAATNLLFNVADLGWSELWPIIQTDADFGKHFFLQNASQLRYPDVSLATKLTTGELGALYSWLVIHFPHIDDQPIPLGVAYTPTPRQEIADYRDSIIRLIVDLGTKEAVDIIAQLVSQFPDLPDATHYLYTAKKNLRRNSWVPIEPVFLLRLITNRNLRYVDSADQLLAVILQSLDRLQSKLTQSETPAAIDLWNEVWISQGKFKWTPKEETRLSDYIKRHLVADLQERDIIVNREVEIRPRQGNSAGQRTDLYVVASPRVSSPQNREALKLIIEVKANWHDELLTAIETQLVDNYLMPNGLTHGLYLVGWYNCTAWDPEDGGRKNDGRKPKAYRYDQATVEQMLDQKAKDLSHRGLTIKYASIDVSLA